MNGPHLLGDPAELAALYVAGAMPPSELAEFESHLEAGCDACATELRALAAAAGELYAVAPAVAPRPELRAALLRRIDEQQRAGGDSHDAAKSPQIWRDWPSDAAGADMFIRRALDGAWEPVEIDGIEIRRLFVDRQRDQTTMLVRMAAGTSYPRHTHHGPEECFVLQGDLSVGDEVLRAGDYQRAAPSSRHGVQSTAGGCLLLIVSSMSDELDSSAARVASRFLSGITQSFNGVRAGVSFRCASTIRYAGRTGGRVLLLKSKDGATIELSLSLSQLKKIYVALFHQLHESRFTAIDELDEDDMLLTIQTYLQRQAREAGVDGTIHSEWEAFLGIQDAPSCAQRLAGRQPPGA